MDDLVTFLRAQLDADEAAARGAEAVWDTRVLLGAAVTGSEAHRRLIHVARHDPASVLRDIAAKRAIVNEYDRLTNLDTSAPEPHGAYKALAECVRRLAAAYMTRSEALALIQKQYGGATMDDDPEWVEEMVTDLMEPDRYA